MLSGLGKWLSNSLAKRKCLKVRQKPWISLADNHHWGGGFGPSQPVRSHGGRFAAINYSVQYRAS